MSKNILLLNDMPGYGKVALAAQIPILSYMGYRVHGVPTAILSNTLNYGKVEKLLTDDYLFNTINNWEKMDVSFDAIATGMIFGKRQATFIEELCQGAAEKNIKVFSDPIMADNGKLYNGVTEENISDFRKIISFSDCCFPNYTEAVMLTGETYQKDGISKIELYGLIKGIRELGVKSVIITSLIVEGENVVACFDHTENEISLIPYSRLDLNIPGAGDIFLALVMGMFLKNGRLKAAVEYAVNVLWKMIDRNKDSQKTFPGIRVEECLHFIDEKL